MSKAIIEAVHEFVQTCPLLTEGRLNADFLPPDGDSYLIHTVPCTAEIKRYRDGTTRRQFLFTLESQVGYKPEMRRQMESVGLFEQFAHWLEKQTSACNFPDLGGKRTVQKLEVLTWGYVPIPETDLARYQTQCKLTYTQKGCKK